MNAPSLPAYLQARQNRKRLADDATAGLGASLPAHISTEGSVFTLVDAAGNTQRLTFTAQDGRQYQQPFLDACIVDLNAGVSKRFYGTDNKYTKDATKPPVCWSANGVVPSRESTQQQARTCAECAQNVRGSATSEKSGASIKACRDEKWLALVVPQTGLDTIFRYTITPGSFKKWKAYSELFKGRDTDISDVITRFEFDPDEPNTIKFSAIGYIDERTAALADQALIAGATDVIVGRDEHSAALAAPALQAALPPAQQQAASSAGQAAQPAPFVSSAAPASAAAAPSTMPAPAPSATPPEAPKTTRPGRPKKADAAPAAPAPLTAPFPVNQAPAAAQPAAAPSNFGIQPGVAPDPQLSATLNNLFLGAR